MLRLVRNVLFGVAVYIYLIPFAHTNETLIPYTNEVLAIVNNYCRPEQYNRPIHEYIYFSKLKDEEVGACETGFHKFIIKVDSRFWHHASENERYEVIFHEMYHCLFLKDHVEDPKNYMYYRMVNLDKEIIVQQFTDDIKKICLNKGVTNGS